MDFNTAKIPSSSGQRTGTSHLRRSHKSRGKQEINLESSQQSPSGASYLPRLHTQAPCTTLRPQNHGNPICFLPQAVLDFGTLSVDRPRPNYSVFKQCHFTNYPVPSGLIHRRPNVVPNIPTTLPNNCYYTIKRNGLSTPNAPPRHHGCSKFPGCRSIAFYGSKVPPSLLAFSTYIFFVSDCSVH